jgi:sugar transferase (PEP-CTERM/EpsH1 system associated)
MEPLLLLVHRIPFPPNKGDKVRSFHLLKFLASRYRVYLGTFVDDPADREHVARLDEYCASSKVIEIQPLVARLRSAVGFVTGEPLTLPYYRDASLGRWVETVVREQRIEKAVVFSSAMAQYTRGVRGLRTVVDFVDVDSAKWEEYGQARGWPLSAVYKREGARMLAFERSVAMQAEASVFVTASEAALFRRLAPECADRVRHAQNGVDVDYFTPTKVYPSPYGPDEEPIVFTGAMDYWPNVDAVSWFVNEVLPTISSARPRARFYIVGMRPTSEVVALGRHGNVVVTGLVPDVRPYLKHARVVVAPLRIARGIQNKVLEAMAMARPVVVSDCAADALSAERGVDLETATSAEDFARKTVVLMDAAPAATALGVAGRKRVLADYEWTTNLSSFANLLDEEVSARTALGSVKMRQDPSPRTTCTPDPT